METNQTPEIFNQEIAELEAKLAAKKQELMQSGAETPEKHVFKEVIREHAFASEAPKPAVPVKTSSPATTATHTTTPQEEAQLNAMVAHAFTKGLKEAVKEARKTQSPFFIDLLHDRLADEYYDKLVAARKIKIEH